MLTIGIIGGGQLGKMSAMAAAELGIRVFVLSDSADSPAAQVTPNVIVSSYDDNQAIANLASHVDFITFEFENVDYTCIANLEAAGHKVRPSSKILAISQDRLLEKQFIQSIGLKTAPFFDPESAAECKFGPPLLLKQRRFGYDGKGQSLINNEQELLAQPIKNMIAESIIPFSSELSVIVARGIDGNMVSLPVSRNIHKNGILHKSIVPSGLSCDKEAQIMGKKLAESLELVGVLAVEMFYIDGQLIINEIAPRPHNSGHWSMDCCSMSQFDLHVRAVCDLPLAKPKLLFPCTMQNLIDKEVDGYQELMHNGNARIHIYGKHIAKEGRKMGHVNFCRI